MSFITDVMSNLCEEVCIVCIVMGVDSIPLSGCISNIVQPLWLLYPNAGFLLVITDQEHQ